MSGYFDFLRNKQIRWIGGFSLIAAGVAILKDNMQGGKFTNKIRADGKVVVITGANSGIGSETAQELAKRGAHVYMACRDMKSCETVREQIVIESGNRYVYCRECDLASLKSVRKFVQNFQNEQSRLDILINNAGVMRCPRSLTQDGIELQLGVNHMGHFLLTNLLLDLLKKSAPSRIVVVSSLAHTRGKINIQDLNSDASYDEGDAYSQSKLANVLFSRQLSKLLEGTNVSVNSLHPGVVDTNLMRHMGLFTNFFAKIIVKPITWPFLKTAKSGAQTTLYVALEPSLEKVTGKYFSDCKEKDVSETAENDTMAKWLWEVSDKWTSIRK